MALRLSLVRDRTIANRADSFEARIGSMAMAVAARLARGNVALQSERALTEERLNAERDALKKRLKA